MYSIKDYFNDISKKFDGYYESRKTRPLSRIIHNLLRRPGLEKRFGHAVEIVGDCRGKKILDVGCGSGIYSVFFARVGAEVTGIDFARSMIDLANRKMADIKGIACSFICEDFLRYEVKNLFDYSLAIGVFDYIKMNDVVLYLDKLKRSTRSKIIATFPKRYTFQMPIRKLYLLGKGVKVYFYTKRQIMKLCNINSLKPRFYNSGPIWTVEMYK